MDKEIRKMYEGEALKRCLECGDVILYGRPDKKFCSQHCRNEFNNRKRVDSRHIRERIRRHLDKNYAILDKLIRIGVDTLALTELSSLGYDPSYVTSYHKNGRWNEFGCYDITFLKTPTRIFHLMRVEIIHHDFGNDTEEAGEAEDIGEG